MYLLEINLICGLLFIKSLIFIFFKEKNKIIWFAYKTIF